MAGKEIGSATFGTSVIKTDEFVLLGKVMQKEGLTPAQTVAHIECIDDLLLMQRSMSIINSQRRTAKGTLRKGAGFYDFMDNRVGNLVDELKEIEDGHNEAG